MAVGAHLDICSTDGSCVCLTETNYARFYRSTFLTAGVEPHVITAHLSPENTEFRELDGELHIAQKIT